MKRIRLVTLMMTLLAAALLASVPGISCHALAAEQDSRLGSVGLQVVPTSTGELAVLQVPAATPAAKAGLKPGDLIVQIDGFALAGSNFADVVSQHLWGVEGSVVTIHYLRPGEAGRKSVMLRRAAADPKLTVSPSVRNELPHSGEKR